MNFDLLIDLHKSNIRQGPGSDMHTILAMQLANIIGSEKKLDIADIGCGTGQQTLVLAENTNANIVAVDVFDEFLSVLNANAEQHNLSSSITTKNCSMDALDFAKESLDVVWSEGALYNIGFKNAVSYLTQFLKKGGVMACSEITWLTKKRPNSLTEHWNSEYSEIGYAEDKIKVLTDNGLNLVGYFTLDETCWMQNYYNNLLASFDSFLERHNNSKDAIAIVDAEKYEIDLYERYKDYISYGFYIATKEKD